MNQIKKLKDDMREKYLAKRKSIPAEEKAKLDKAICDRAMSMSSFRYADTVLLYAATSDEIDVSHIAEASFAKGKKVAFPRCNKESHTMNYHYVTSLDMLKPDSYGISEPPADAPIYDPDIDIGSALCFVPGLVYDKAGFRLGYGKGFYDRYLSSFRGCSLGVVYSDYILPTVPRGRYDVSVTILLTEKGVKLTSEN